MVNIFQDTNLLSTPFSFKLLILNTFKTDILIWLDIIYFLPVNNGKITVENSSKKLKSILNDKESLFTANSY